MKEGFILPENEEVSDEDIKLINKFTKRDLQKNEVYIFSAILCDNEIDKENEKFTIQSLEKLSTLFVGKVGVLNCGDKFEKKSAKIFSCKIKSTEKTNILGENYCELIAKVYIPRTKGNEDLILEIDSGIKKEVKIKCLIEKTVCSICKENSKMCVHKKGKKYNSSGSNFLCYTMLENPIDVYEWSFVSVSPQNSAGEIKTFSKNVGNEENIIKKLKDATNKNGMQKIYKMIESLENDVFIGQRYVSKLKDDVMKHFLFLKPQIDSLSLKKMIDVLSVEDLEKIKKRFSNSSMKIQLFSSKKANFNREYKI